MNKLKSMDKADIRNKLIIFSKAMVAVIILMLLAVVLVPEKNLDLGFVWIPIIILLLISCATCIVVVILELAETIKTSGTTEIGRMLVQIAIIGAIMYFANKWLSFDDNTSIVHWMIFAAFVVCFQKIPEYWRRYDKKYAESNKRKK